MFKLTLQNRRCEMYKKLFYPLIIHILLCVICCLIFILTWMGPEGGLLFYYFPNMDRKIIFILTAVVQVIVVLIYFYVGKKMCSFSPRSLLAIASICILNIISVMIIYCFYRDIGAAMKLFAVFGGAPFFFLNVMNDLNIVTNIIAIIAPSVIMFAGSVYGYLKSNS